MQKNSFQSLRHQQRRKQIFEKYSIYEAFKCCLDLLYRLCHYSFSWRDYRQPGLRINNPNILFNLHRSSIYHEHLQFLAKTTSKHLHQLRKVFEAVTSKDLSSEKLIEFTAWKRT